VRKFLLQPAILPSASYLANGWQLLTMPDGAIFPKFARFRMANRSAALLFQPMIMRFSEF